MRNDKKAPVFRYFSSPKGVKKLPGGVFLLLITLHNNFLD
jgi:hypothetical protein